jgi:hypothetical protein
MKNFHSFFTLSSRDSPGGCDHAFSYFVLHESGMGEMGDIPVAMTQKPDRLGIPV